MRERWIFLAPVPHWQTLVPCPQPMHMTFLEMIRPNPRPLNIPPLNMTLARMLLAPKPLRMKPNIIHTGTVLEHRQDTLS